MKLPITVLVICMASSALAEAKPRLSNRKFIAVAVTLGAAALADGITTCQFRSRGYLEAGAARFLIGQRPSCPRVMLTGTAVITGELLLARKINRDQKSIRMTGLDTMLPCATLLMSR